jgi:hypothetical protein
VTRVATRHSPTVRSRDGHQHLQKFSNFKFKKRYDQEVKLTTLDLWEGMGRHDVLLHWKCKSHDVLLHWKCKSRFLDIVIDNHRGRGHDLWFQFFKKVRSFTPFHRMSGIRSVSGIWPTCQGWCPPLDYDQFKILQQHAERTLTRSVGDYNQFKILQQHTERTLTRSVGDCNQFKILQQHAERTLTRSVGD